MNNKDMTVKKTNPESNKDHTSTNTDNPKQSSAQKCLACGKTEQILSNRCLICWCF